MASAPCCSFLAFGTCCVGGGVNGAFCKAYETVRREPKHEETSISPVGSEKDATASEEQWRMSFAGQKMEEAAVLTAGEIYDVKKPQRHAPSTSIRISFSFLSPVAAVVVVSELPSLEVLGAGDLSFPLMSS